jgi:hypothetical protein
MGNKAGYAEVILAALGLRSGQGAGAYLWAEADPDVAALLRCYPNAEMLRRVAEIIRGWADEEPRALWERLRAERKARGPRVDAEGTAGWMWSIGNSWKGEGAHLREPSDERIAQGVDACLSADGLTDRCQTLAEYATIVSSNRLVNMAGPDLMNTGNGGTRFGGEFATPPGDVAEAFERVAGEVAAHTFVAGRSIMGDGGFVETEDTGGRARGLRPENFADRVNTIERGSRWPPVLVLPTIPTAAEVAAWLGTPGDLDGVVVYQDPPYLGTTGYQSDIPRTDVIATALDFAAMGAVVCVSEAEPLADLTGQGWPVVEITEGRRGQKRTFSAQKREYLTMNREPAHRVATQPSLFGAA